MASVIVCPCGPAISKASEFDSSPEEPFKTDMRATPPVVRSEPGIVAVRVVLVMAVRERVVPFQRAVEVASNPVPVNVTDRFAPNAGVDSCESVVKTGAPVGEEAV